MPRHESVWSATAQLPECGPLHENLALPASHSFEDAFRKAAGR